MNRKDIPKKVKHCVLICESLKADYDSASPFIEIGNYSAIDYTLSLLAENDVEEVFMFYSRLKTQIEQYHQWASKAVQLKLHLHYMKPGEMKSFGDVMREVHFRNLVSDDFLVMYADNFANLRLNKMIASHFEKKAELKNVVLTTAMRRGLTNQIHILNSATGQILQVDTQIGHPFTLNTEKINLKKLHVAFRRDLIPVQVFVCTIQVVKSFKETYEYQTMQDFIIGMLTSQVYQEKINAYQLSHNERSFRVSRGGDLYQAYLNYVCGYLHPYSIHHDEQMSRFHRPTTDKQYSVGRFNRVIRKGTRISSSAQLSNNVYVGQQSTIGEYTVVTKSVIGAKCHIGKGINLNHCIVLNGCTLMENAKFEYCLVEKVNDTYKIQNFKAIFHEEFEQLIDRELFLESPEGEGATFEEELEGLLAERPEESTILVSELVRIGKEFNRSQGDLTRQMIRIIRPQGVKGIGQLADEWGEVLLKVHHDEELSLMNSLLLACTQIPEYTPAFNPIIQYFHNEEVLKKESILKWFGQEEVPAAIAQKCRPFLDKLQEESEEEESDDDET